MLFFGEWRAGRTLTDKPYQYVPVESHVFELKFLLVPVLMYKGGLKLSFTFRTELFHLNLLSQVNPDLVIVVCSSCGKLR